VPSPRKTNGAFLVDFRAWDIINVVPDVLTVVVDFNLFFLSHLKQIITILLVGAAGGDEARLPVALSQRSLFPLLTLGELKERAYRDMQKMHEDDNRRHLQLRCDVAGHQAEGGHKAEDDVAHGKAPCVRG